jgi:hypothetical protein
MKKFLSIAGVAAMAVLFLHAVAGDTPRLAALDTTNPIMSSSTAVAVPPRPPAPSGNQSTGTFCDNSTTAGNSPSCETWAQGHNLLVCPNGATPRHINCSLPQGNCPVGVACSCTFTCGSYSLVE